MTDIDHVPLERLEAQITEWSGHIAAATAQLLGWIAAYDRREGWRSWGCKSAAHWLSWKCGDTLHTAREKVRVARALEQLPLIDESFRAGALSYSKVRAITRVAVPADDADWRDIALNSTGAQLERTVTAVKSALDRDENRDARKAFERRTLSRSSKTGGVDRLLADAPCDMAATIMAAIEMIGSRLLDEAVAGTGRTRREVLEERGGLAALHLDALVQMAERVLAAESAAAERGDIGRLQLNLDTDAVAAMGNAAGAADDPGEQTLGGRRIAPDVCRRWACDIRASVMLEHEGRPHDHGRDTRTISRHLRRKLHRRDGGHCRFPGCGSASWLHAHHIHHWVDGGPTELDNLVSLCGFHHQLVHEGGWAVAISSDAIVWSEPDGTPATVEPLTGAIEPVRRAGEAGGATVSSIESRWQNDRLDFGFVVSVITEHCIRVRGPEADSNRHQLEAIDSSVSPGPD